MAKSVAELLREAAAVLERGQGAGLQQAAFTSEPRVVASESQPHFQPRPGTSHVQESRAASVARETVQNKYCTASEFEAQLQNEFPKLKEGGGFELLRPYGATRSKNLEIIPCPAEGYTPKYLEAYGIQMATIYVRPLQRDLSMDKSMFTAAHGTRMTIQCIYCSEVFCHAEIQDHVDKCNLPGTETIAMESDEPSSSRQKNCNQEQQTMEESQGVPSDDDDGRHGCVQALDVSERQHSEKHGALEDGGSNNSECRGSDLEARGRSAVKTHDWKLEPELNLAAYKFRRNLLQEAEEQPELVARIDFTRDTQDREREILTFYKRHEICWARPFSVILRGDSAIGDGVVRHFLSFVMSRVQFGFDLNLDGCGRTLFFIGQEDHLVPSTSRILLDSDLFRAVGRMIGHSFIHGGPLITGLSRSMFRLMTGEQDEPVIVELDDCPDTDIVEIVSVLQGPGKLTEAERRQVNEVGISWDLPSVTEENRKWLAQCILQHAVVGRREKQVQQIKKGLKDIGVLSMIKERPAIIERLFPRAASQVIEPEMILDKTIWPAPDSDEDMDYQLEDSCKVTGFFRQYIEHGTSEELKKLVQFWVGWTSLPQHLYVEVSTSVPMPTAYTCRETIKLPVHYRAFEDFRKDLQAAVSTIEYGFGLI
ncbi:uncharacterized protein LOC143497276 isoform X2 [Brachyhypopomus gauderio]|uniref:uncharacterized protein LOC143497276 isoform X2 n=1 Tax=Brachyhypopomus gauderio TaxID=698409 RepID=UPI0040434CF0